MSNQHLERAGSLERIDHRRLSAQCTDHVEAIEKELQQEAPSNAVVDLRLDAARSLDREPQEKHRWLRRKETHHDRFWREGFGEKRPEAELVAYKRCRYRPERPQRRLLRVIEGKDT